MFYRKRLDIVLPETAPSGTGAQTIKFKIKQEPRRLEEIVLKLRVTTGSAIPTGAAWGGLAGIVKEIRVRVDDILGSRNAVQVSGIGLLGFNSEYINLDPDMQAAYGSTGWKASTTYELTYRIPLRHPGVAEPFGNQLSLPLSQKFMNQDLYLEVDMHDIVLNGTVFGNTASSSLAYHATEPMVAELTLREVPDGVTYMPSELRTDMGSFTTTASPYYEFGSSGYLTGFKIQGLSKDFANDMTRASLVAAGGQVRLEYGRDIVAKTNEAFMRSRNAASRFLVYPLLDEAIVASATLEARNFTGEMYFDFLTDGPDGDAYAINSVYPLDLDITGGDKFRIYFNDLASTNYRAHITYHKLLPKNREDLKGLVQGI